MERAEEGEGRVPRSSASAAYPLLRGLALSARRRAVTQSRLSGARACTGGAAWSGRSWPLVDLRALTSVLPCSRVAALGSVRLRGVWRVAISGSRRAHAPHTASLTACALWGRAAPSALRSSRGGRERQWRVCTVRRYNSNACVQLVCLRCVNSSEERAPANVRDVVSLKGSERAMRKNT